MSNSAIVNILLYHHNKSPAFIEFGLVVWIGTRMGCESSIHLENLLLFMIVQIQTQAKKVLKWTLPKSWRPRVKMLSKPSLSDPNPYLRTIRRGVVSKIRGSSSLIASHLSVDTSTHITHAAHWMPPTEATIRDGTEEIKLFLCNPFRGGYQRLNVEWVRCIGVFVFVLCVLGVSGKQQKAPAMYTQTFAFEHFSQIVQSVHVRIGRRPNINTQPAVDVAPTRSAFRIEHSRTLEPGNMASPICEHTHRVYKKRKLQTRIRRLHDKQA